MSQERTSTETQVCPRCRKSKRSASLTQWVLGGNCSCDASSDYLKAPLHRFDPPVTLAQVAHEIQVGTLLQGKYRIDTFIGEGGMGQVFLSTDQSGQRVAVKVMRSDLMNDEHAMKRFQAEGQAMSSLSHPNLVKLLDCGLTEYGAPYFVLEYIEGESLSALMSRNGHLDPVAATELFTQVAEGMAYAHGRGIIHRDVKPTNILFSTDADGKVVPKVVDFGIAKSVNPGLDAKSMTMTGQLIGTPMYMSPEQCEGGSVDKRSDIYSLGCVIYEALCGPPPFEGESAVRVMVLHASEKPKPFSGYLQIPADLEAVVMKTLAKHPNNRYQSMRELGLDLAAVGRKERPLGLTRSETNAFKRLVAWPLHILSALSQPRTLSFNYLIMAGVIGVLVGVLCVTLLMGLVPIHREEPPATPVLTSLSDTALIAPKLLDAEEVAVPIDDSMFSSLEGPKEHRIRVFDFGKSRIGRLEILDTTHHLEKSVAAVGVVRVPADATLGASATLTEICNHPHWLARFRPDDLCSLSLRGQTVPDTDYDIIDDTLAFGANLTMLKELSVTGSVSMRGLENLRIDGMSKLRSLAIFFSAIDGPELAKHRALLRRLNILQICELHDPMPVLKALQGSTQLVDLNLKNDDLSEAAPSYIATIPNLRLLDLRGTRITEAGLIELTKLEKLQILFLPNSITAASLPTLHKFAHLRELTLPYSFKSNAQVQKLQLPHCTVIFDTLSEVISEHKDDQLAPEAWLTQDGKRPGTTGNAGQKKLRIP